jgi:hypothetical protein
MAVLMHTAINWSQGVTSELFPKVGFNETRSVIALAIAAVVLVVATRGRLGYANPSFEAVRAVETSARV